VNELVRMVEQSWRYTSLYSGIQRPA
jgi:hypothetical protein